MNNQEKYQSPTQNIFTNGPLMTRIDGSSVRLIRERKGLTQLYLATAVGVTTDTISRWENKRYPSIKRENALRLAEALEVDLEEILEKDEDSGEEVLQGDASSVASDETVMPQGTVPVRKIFFVIAGGIILAAISLFLFLIHKEKTVPFFPLKAERVLPTHTPPGKPFPVLINISTSAQQSPALIVKETLPEGSQFLEGNPPFTAVDKKRGEAKWIQKAEEGVLVLVYMAATMEGMNGIIHLEGKITVKQGAQSTVEIGGEDTVNIEPYHWADMNRDKIIDDDEILTVYDTYSSIEGLDFGMEQIEDIWSGSGYDWDAKREKFIIQTKE